MKIEIWQHVYSSAPAEPGVWALKAERLVSALPHAGDFIELAPGWSSSIVKDTTFMADGRLHVELANVKTDSPDVLTEHHTLADEHDWEWVGREPARTGKS